MGTSLYGKSTGSTATRDTKYFKLGPETIQVQGIPGISAYEVAVENGYVGTEEEWLESLVGAQGPVGSPMSIWTGTQAAYNALGTWDDDTMYFIIG